jgi:hypothetical protein
MEKYLDVEWIAVQAGVPVSFLIGIPVFFVFVLTLASMMGTTEPENYRVGRHAEARSSNTWIAPLGLVIFIAITLSYFGQYFVPS